MLNDCREREIIGGNEHVMVILSNQGADCVHETGAGSVWVGYVPEITDRPGSNITLDARERRHIDGDAMSSKGSRDRDRDSRNHSQDEDGLFHLDLRVRFALHATRAGSPAASSFKSCKTSAANSWIHRSRT